jgi:hypothetical protein
VKRAARTVLMLVGLAVAVPVAVGSALTSDLGTGCLAAGVILAILAGWAVARWRRLRWSRLARKLRSRSLYAGPDR